MSAFGPPISGLRVIRFVLVLIAVGVVVNTGANVLLFVLNAHRVDQINDERAANVRRACEEVNHRHDATIRQLRVLVNATPPGPRKRRAEQNIKGTIALLEAIVPRRDCQALVERQVDVK